MPEPQITPARSGSISVNESWESLMASSATTIAYWVKGSSFRASFRSMKFETSKPLISQANLVLKRVASKRVIAAAPDFPFFKPSQYSWRVFPIGVNAPTPVITTRLKVIRWVGGGDIGLFLHVLLEVRNRLPNGSNVLSLVVRDRNVEFLFEFHDQFYGIQRIGSKVVGKACFRSNFRLFYT